MYHLQADDSATLHWAFDIGPLQACVLCPESFRLKSESQLD